MWLDQVSNPGPLALESDALPTGLHGLAQFHEGEGAKLFSLTNDTIFGRLVSCLVFNCPLRQYFSLY